MKCLKRVLTSLLLISSFTVVSEQAAHAGYQGSQNYYVAEGGSITATAPAGAIYTQVIFASYGTPTGSGPFSLGGCNASTSVSYVGSIFLNQSTAVIYANNTNFGDPCSGTGKTLAITLGYTYSLVNSAIPTLSGTTTVGQTLTSNQGTWNYTPTSYAYQWQRATTSGGTYSDVAGATNSTYSLIGSDVNYFFRMKLTATNDAGTSSAVYSSPTASAVGSAATSTTLSIAGSPSTATYRVNTPITIGVTANGKVTVFANGKVIPGCKNAITSGFAFTCNWKPAIHGSVTLSATYSPTIAGYLASASSSYKIQVIVRATKR